MAIGLTGGIACGKSTVGGILAGQGAAVLDADDVAHAMIRREGPLFRRVRREFGPEMVGPDGEIDRATLGRVVFGNARKRKALERIIHPAVIAAMRSWARRTVRAGHNAVGIVPLLFEVGMTDPWDEVVCVVSPMSVVLRRLKQRGLPAVEARRRVRAQKPVRMKAALSDHVILNDGSLRTLKSKTLKLWRELLNKE